MKITPRRSLSARIFPSGLAVAFALAAVISASAQAPSHSADNGFRIAGRIVNSSTGEPIPRAAIAALAERDNHTLSSVLSDADGRFSMEHLPAGKYPLTASKRGFRTAFYDEHEDFNTAIVTGEGQDTEHLQFQLAPAAILRGVITADGGDPVAGANVMLFKSPDASHPGERVMQVDGAISDDTGAYEFSNLPAGQYFVAVKADPWYAMHGRANRNPDDTNANLDVAYPITFFDSTIDQASAAPITLAEGSREEANISLHAVPALHLRLPRSIRRGAPPVELRETVFGNQIQSRGADMVALQQGTIEVTGIAPGHYQLTHGDPPRTMELDAASDLEIDANAGTQAITVAGTLRTAGGAAIAEDANVVLEAADGPGRATLNAIAHKGQFQLDDVLPGRWNVSVYVGNGGQSLPVMSIASGARVVAGNQISVLDQPLNLGITVSREQNRVQGFARANGRPASGVMVFLVPRQPAAYQALVRRDQSDSDGSFALRDVPPGEYTVIAVEEGWKLDWRHREAIARYLPGGVAVTVTDRSPTVLQLGQPVPAVPR